MNSPKEGCWCDGGGGDEDEDASVKVCIRESGAAIEKSCMIIKITKIIVVRSL